MGLGDLMAELLGEIEFTELASPEWAEPVKSEISTVKNALAAFGLYIDFDHQPSADDIAARIAEYKRLRRIVLASFTNGWQRPTGSRRTEMLSFFYLDEDEQVEDCGFAWPKAFWACRHTF